ncbi:MAG TPA: DUF1801 domain-containing protein [Phaeodactylibacter sp.]|nr:DUF1801 domain-containing protein [Phaeodactylibacter sp.]
MSPVEAFILDTEGNQRDVMMHFHLLFTEDLKLTPKLKFKIPFYYGRTWICYLNPIKNTQVELVFIRGRELSNAEGLLQHRNRKQVAGIILKHLEDIPHQDLLEIIHEAISLDEQAKSKQQ